MAFCIAYFYSRLFLWRALKHGTIPLFCFVSSGRFFSTKLVYTAPRPASVLDFFCFSFIGHYSNNFFLARSLHIFAAFSAVCRSRNAVSCWTKNQKSGFCPDACCRRRSACCYWPYLFYTIRKLFISAPYINVFPS